MKETVCDAVNLLGGRIEEEADGSLLVQAPEGTMARELLEGATQKRLVLDRKTAAAGTVLLSPGSLFLERLAAAVGRYGQSRHGRFEAQKIFNRKEAADLLCVTLGRVSRFSSGKGRLLTVRLWIKAAILGDELNEHMFGVEVWENGTSSILPSQPDPWTGVIWDESPPLPLSRFEALVERGLHLAEREAARLAEDMKRSSLERLYRTLDRLSRYYDQLREEALSSGKEHAADGALAEYERRKTDEIQGARVRARLDVISVETLSTPLKHLEWTLERETTERKVKADLDLVNGRLSKTIRCEVCGKATTDIGLGIDGTLFCPSCAAFCRTCGRELIGVDAETAFACAATGEPVCDQHAVICESCKKRIHVDQGLKCREGCAVCPTCARVCPDCEEGAVWCPQHVSTNSLGESICPSHVFFCHVCKEPFPLSRVVHCASCGMTLCPGCSAICAGCGKSLCPAHLIEGRCFPCSQEVKKWKSSFQRSLF